MPAFHSTFETTVLVGNLGVFPLRTKIRGPAPSTQEQDIIDECIELYKPNAFFKNFEITTSADRVLVYLMVFIQECITRIAAGKLQDLKAGWSFCLPGDAGFPLNALYDAPGRDAETMRSYLTQLRGECAARILELACPDGVPSKWWVCFAKRKFMGIASISG